MTASAYIGDTLVSGVGPWEWAGTQYTRQWESCEADGGSCQTISGEKAATYVVKAADLGRRLRVRIGVDSNQANKKPDPIEVFTPLSDVVTPAAGDPRSRRRRAAAVAVAAGVDPAAVRAAAVARRPRPPADKTRALDEPSSRCVPKTGKLTLTLSEPAKLKIVVKKGKKTVSTITVSVAAGKRTLALTKKKLKKGAYKATITPVDAAGNTGAARTVSFKIKQ